MTNSPITSVVGLFFTEVPLVISDGIAKSHSVKTGIPLFLSEPPPAESFMAQRRHQASNPSLYVR